jgi:hypothetical protein
LIEPSLGNPNHRGTAHSATMCVAVASAVAVVDGMEDGLRDAAERAASRRCEAWQGYEASEGVDAIGYLIEASFYLLLEVLAAFLAGVPAGALAGYMSHVAADACSTRSVPVV